MVAILDRIRGLFETPLFLQLKQNPLFALPGEFCNDPEANEWHSLALGFLTPLDREPFDANLIPTTYPAEVRAYILSEYHYYRFGRWLGRLVLLILAAYVANSTLLPAVL